MMIGLEDVVPTTTTWWESPESPTHKEQSQIAQNNYQKKAQAQTNNLTRFGLNAYVLGAIEKEINLLGRWLQLLAVSLSARELQQIPSLQIQTLETNNSP